MKRLFNFYLDDDVKNKLNEKLLELYGETTKGQLASLIRVLLIDFLNTPNENLGSLKGRINSEYQYTLTKNKRSDL